MQLKKLIYQICLSVALVSGGWAQIGTNPTGGPDIYGHNWITSAASGTTIGFDWLDARSGTRANFSSDDTSSAISLGFTFNFYGTDYTQIYISTGGFISFDPFTRSPGFYEAVNDSGVPNDTLPNNIVAAGWDILEPTFNDDSDVYYRQFGSAPYRKFVIQWHDFSSIVKVSTFKETLQFTKPCFVGSNFMVLPQLSCKPVSAYAYPN